MVNVFPYLAGVTGGVFYGAATIFEQIATKQEKKISNINPFKLLSLFVRGYYFLGLVLDLLGWLFFLIAVRSLPLFMVQSFMALSIVVSALLDFYWLKHPVYKSEKLAILLVITGVIILSFVGKPGPAINSSELVKLFVIFVPVILAIFAASFVKRKKSSFTNFVIAAMTGISFGATSIASRIIIISDIKQPIEILLAISLVLNAVFGMVLLSIALQRDRVNRVNSILLSTEIVWPSLFGILFLGDGVRNGMWLLMYVGLVLVVLGTVVTSKIDLPNFMQKS